ncbi:unnamed protein product, partial [Meganyctiphanes norvegica]
KMMRPILFLGVVVAAAVAQDAFIKKYAFSKAMVSCFGKDAYHTYAHKLKAAIMECKAEMHEHYHKNEHQDGTQSKGDTRQSSVGASLRAQIKHFIPVPLYIAHPVYPKQLDPWAQFQQYQGPKHYKREALYDDKIVKKMAMKVEHKVNTLLCVLRKFEYVDNATNILYDNMKRDAKMITGLDSNLKEDLLKAVDHCKAAAMCIEDSNIGMPAEIKQILSFLKCEKKTRMDACMKADLRKHIAEFDLSVFYSEADEDAKVEKLLHVLWGADPGNDPLDLLA